MFVFVDYVTCLQMHVLIVLMHFRVEVKSEGNMRMLKACTKHDNKHAFYFIHVVTTVGRSTKRVHFVASSN